MTRAHTLKEIMMSAPEPRQGREIPEYPLLSKTTGGLGGVWVVGGPTGAGKTTFALNLVGRLAAADPDLQILYLDFELGAAKIIGRLVSAFGAEAPVLAQTTYYRDLPTLDADRRREKRPVLIVVDTVQKLGLDGGTSDQRRAAIDAAVRQFERWKIDDGHAVIAVSQAGRAAYDRRPGKADFKESGGIEEAADVALHVWQAAAGATPRVSIAKLATRRCRATRSNWSATAGAWTRIGCSR
jgi:replicative DNA helicase